VGAQAGKLEASVEAGVDARALGLMVSASRAVIFAGSGEDYAEQARMATIHLRDSVNAVRRPALATA